MFLRDFGVHLPDYTVKNGIRKYKMSQTSSTRVLNSRNYFTSSVPLYVLRCNVGLFLCYSGPSHCGPFET
jgi:hypothetical protein